MAKRKKFKMSRNTLVLVIAGIALLILSLWANYNDQQVVSSVLSDEELLERGQSVYEQNCIACHGPGGEGHGEVKQAPALNGSEHSWHHPDGDLYRIVSDGLINMPSFKEELSHEERIAVIRYFQSWWPADMLSIQQSASKQNPMP